MLVVYIINGLMIYMCSIMAVGLNALPRWVESFFNVRASIH